jgi:hypothetical protein
MTRYSAAAGFVSLTAALVLTAGPRNAAAQDRGRDWTFDATASLEFVGGESLGRVQQAGEKSPVLAGFLSWPIPGLGSYYARNSGHGTRHLVIHGVALGVFIWGVAETTDEILDEIIIDEDDIHPALWVGLTALTINTIWAIVTGVNDAIAYNETLGAGSLEFRPTVVALETPRLTGFDTAHRGTPGVGVRLVRFAF